MDKTGDTVSLPSDYVPTSVVLAFMSTLLQNVSISAPSQEVCRARQSKMR